MNKDKLGGIGASEIGALFVRDGIKSKSAPKPQNPVEMKIAHM